MLVDVTVNCPECNRPLTVTLDKYYIRDIAILDFCENTDPAHLQTPYFGPKIVRCSGENSGCGAEFVVDVILNAETEVRRIVDVDKEQ